ncbi:MAG: hypothetical protein ACOYMG_13010 [Candidatus Methylumidiphilus sp.]
MGEVSETITVIFAAFLVATAGYEVRRRQKKLRTIYDVLDKETKHVTAMLEDMVQQGVLKPYTEDTWA